MLFMVIFTFGYNNRDAVVKRRAEKGEMTEPGIKVVGEWASASGHRVFRLIETEDLKALMEGTMVWTDLGDVETYPIVPMDDVLKLIAGRKK
jgi:hypothetical protein